MAFGQSGFVKSSDQPIPGATVTATQGSQTVSTVTDVDGHYAFGSLPQGTWLMQVEMFGFETLKKDVDFATASAPVNFDLKLTEPQFMRRMGQFAGPGGPGQRPGFAPGGAQSRGAGIPGANGPGARAQNGTAQRTGARSAGDNANQTLDQELQNELNGQNTAAPATANTGESSN